MFVRNVARQNYWEIQGSKDHLPNRYLATEIRIAGYELGYLGPIVGSDNVCKKELLFGGFCWIIVCCQQSAD